MRSLESRLNAIWYQGAEVPWVLRALARVYELVLSCRRPANPAPLSVPVVVVGNFTAGGTGKTPVIIALVEYLKTAGHAPGVVSRGYGRTGSDPVTVEKQGLASQSGDEPLLISRRCDVPVRVDSRRRRAADFLAASGCTIIVSDDGLQHRDLPRSLEIEIMDASRAYGNGLLLPAGPLREKPRKVDLRICNGQISDGSSAYGMQLVPGHCRNLETDEIKTLSDFGGVKVHAVAGIGNPERFFGMLRQSGLHVEDHAFPDHHRFMPSDLPEGPVLMTEKDAVKIEPAGRRDLWAVAVDAVLSPAFYLQFSRLLAADGDHHA
jgi:tetraacyldisaccharide 4'-kinase